jgi:hypothetical protein
MPEIAKVPPFKSDVVRDSPSKRLENSIPNSGTRAM